MKIIKVNNEVVIIEVLEEHGTPGIGYNMTALIQDIFSDLRL